MKMMMRTARVPALIGALAVMATTAAHAGEFKDDCAYLADSFDQLTQIINARSVNTTIADIPVINVYSSLQRNVIMVFEARGCDVGVLVDLMRKKPDPKLLAAVAAEPEAEQEDDEAARDVDGDKIETEAVTGPFVATKNVNVRLQPTSKSEKLGVLAAGSVVPVVGRVKGVNWYKVNLEETTGYVYGPLLRIPEEILADAEGGNVQAQNQLGFMFLQTNPNKAVKWWEAAAAQDHAGALFNLGVFYFKGETSGQNLDKAEDYWKQAADKGHAQAKKLLTQLQQSRAKKAAE